MVEIELDIKKSVEENAGDYYNKAKKAKKKLQGIKKIIKEAEQKLEQIKQQKTKLLEEFQKQKPAKKPKKQWYEKFRWFISSSGFLCIGGKDATSNDIIIKKHMAKNDIVFHTEISGSPFFLIKTNGAEPKESDIEETATATACYSRAWKNHISSLNVFYVKPEQVSKTAQAGEYLSKGSFMIRGKKSFINVKLILGIGITNENKIMAGAESVMKAHCKKYVLIQPGTDKKTDIAKKIKKLIGGELDDIVSAMPAGEVHLINRK